MNHWQLRWKSVPRVTALSSTARFSPDATRRATSSRQSISVNFFFLDSSCSFGCQHQHYHILDSVSKCLRTYMHGMNVISPRPRTLSMIPECVTNAISTCWPRYTSIVSMKSCSRAHFSSFFSFHVAPSLIHRDEHKVIQNNQNNRPFSRQQCQQCQHRVRQTRLPYPRARRRLRGR